MNYNEWLDSDVLEDYLDGKLDAKMMHKVERISLEDPFVAEALAGLSQSPKRNQSLSLLQKQLRERVAQKPVEKKMWTITSQRLSIAATAAVLFVTVSLLFYMRESNRREALAKNKNVDVVVAPQIAANKPTVSQPPSAKAEVEVDKALAQAKTNTYAKNNTRTKAIVDQLPKLVVPATTDVQTLIATEMAQSSPKAKVFEDAKLEVLAKNTAKRNETNVQALNSRTAGVTFIPNAFSGRVVSQEDGLPIPNAEVRLMNTDIKTVTNAKGEFFIQKDSIDNYNLAVNFAGFATKEMKVSSNQFSIALEPANNALSEVIIVQSGKKNQGEGTPIKAEVVLGYLPSVGWEAYENYLIKNNRLTKNEIRSKFVHLTFELDKSGTPIHIKVVESSGKTYHAEAIRLLKDGPKLMEKNPDIRRKSMIIKF